MTSTNFYGRTNNPEDSGAVDNNYLQLGKEAYQAYTQASGEHEVCPWDFLVWNQQYAWCEAARAVINGKAKL